MEAWRRELYHNMMTQNSLCHYAKGQTASRHKYVAIKNGRYIYPEDVNRTNSNSPLVNAAKNRMKASGHSESRSLGDYVMGRVDREKGFIRNGNGDEYDKTNDILNKNINNSNSGSTANYISSPSGTDAEAGQLLLKSEDDGRKTVSTSLIKKYAGRPDNESFRDYLADASDEDLKDSLSSIAELKGNFEYLVKAIEEELKRRK